MRRALFIVSTRGLGHITRCRALASVLVQRGWASTMTTKAPLSVSSHDVTVVDMDGEEMFEGTALRAVMAKPVVRIANTCILSDDVETWAIQPTNVPRITVVGSPGAEYYPILPPTVPALLGGKYALLRPEFAEARDADMSLPGNAQHGGLFDCRDIKDWSSTQIAYRMRNADMVISFGGMRALEAACVRKGGQDILVYARNAGEGLNKRGLADGQDHIDGRGCQRVADALEELVK